MRSRRSSRRRRCAALALLLMLSGAARAEVMTATLQFGGDVLIHQALLDDAHDEQADTYDFAHMLAHAAGTLAGTDLTVLNLEVPIAAGKYTGYPAFNSPPALLDALRDAGADVLLCANNHALDRLGKGARQTIESIEAAGLDHIGTARNREEYNAVPMYDLDGINVAIFNYTQHTNGKEKEDAAENLRYAVHYFAVERAQRDIEAARAAGADYVILCVHWGREYERKPTQGVRDWAQALVDAGADLIVGGHPHVLQPYETLTRAGEDAGDALVLYSMGNLLSGQREQYRDSGALFRFTLEKDTENGIIHLSEYGYIPTWVWLDDAGRYRLLVQEDAMTDPPEGMSPEAEARMRAAWLETVEHLGAEHLLSPGATAFKIEQTNWDLEEDSPWITSVSDGASSAPEASRNGY